MFYIYSPQGRTFAGPMEKLRRVGKATEAAYVGTHNDPLTGQETDPDTIGQYVVADRAVSRYQAMLKENSVKESVYHAYQIMTQPVLSITTESTWEDAYDTFIKSGFQVLPILNSKRMLVATLSRNALYEALIGHQVAWKNRLVMELISGEEASVISADPVTDVRRISKVLVEHRLDAIPVVEESHRLVGIVSRTDILRCVTSDPPLSLWC